jgi:hypothetical protein
MATNQTLATGFVQQSVEIPVRPTLMIGLGGTGMEVLKRLRRQFILRYGRAGLPCMRYLWLDTDRSCIEDGGADARLPGVRFTANEFIDLTLPAGAFRDLVDSPNKYRHIHSWLDPRIQAMPDMVNGASQNRQAGRLAFFARYPEIQARICQLVVKELDTENVRKQMTSPVDQGGAGCPHYDPTTLEIVIVNSIAGGTGAGTFLDMAFFLRSQISNGWKLPTQISGYAFLPSIFFPNPIDNGQGQKTHANAMAALRELEYYSCRRDKLDNAGGMTKLASKHDYRVKWDVNGDEQTIIGPPFDLLYLVDNQTDKSSPLTGPHVVEAYEMVANRLFMGYAEGGFAVKLRSTGNNMRGFLGQDVLFLHEDSQGRKIHMEQFGQRFCSLGLSRVYVPADEIRRACGARMACDLLDDWLRVRAIEGPAQEVSAELLATIELDLRQMMDRMTKDGTQNWRDALNGEIARVGQDLQQGLGGSERTQLDRRVTQHFKRLNELLEVKANQPPQQWGKVAAAIDHDLPKKAREHTTQLIERRLREWFAQPHRGLRFSQEALARIVEDLSPLIEDMRRRADRLRQSAETERKRIQKLMGFLRDEQVVFPPQRSSLKELLTQITTRMRTHFAQVLESRALDQAVAHHEWCIGHLGSGSHRDANTNREISGSGVQQRLQTLESDLVGLRRDFAEQLNDADSGRQTLSEYRIYNRGDYELYYFFQPAGGGERQPIGRSHLEKLELGVFQQLGISSIADLIKVFQERGITNLRQSIEVQAFDWFTPTRNEMDLDLRRHLIKLDEHQLEAIRQTLSAWSEPWSHVPWSSSISMQKLLLIGIHPDHLGNDVLKGIANHIEQNSMNSVGKQMLDGVLDGLWVSSEVYGLPAFSVRNIDQYREAYDRELKRSSERHSTCHVHIFPSVQFMGDEEVERHANAVEVLLSTLLLRIVEVRLVTHERSGLRHCEFSFIDRSVPAPVEVQLSHWDQALRLLKKQDAWLEALDRARQAKMIRLDRDDPLIKNMLLALHQMIKAGKRFGRRTVNDISNPNIEVISAEYTRVNGLINQLLVKADMTTEELNAYVESLSVDEIEARLEVVSDDMTVLYIPRA